MNPDAAPPQPLREDFASAGTTNAAGNAGYASHLEILPSVAASMGIPILRVRRPGIFRQTTSTGALNFFSSLPVPCESVILVWYQRNSPSALFRCNNEKPMEKKKERRERERRERQHYLSPSVFSFTATLLAPDRDKAAGITLFPQRLSPSIVQILLTRVFARNPFHHRALGFLALSSFSFSLSPFLPDVYAGTTYSRIIFSMDFVFFMRARKTKHSICVDKKATRW